MLRFPNPGSTIENFVQVYKAAFERLNGRVVNLDDIVDAVVAANLATSSGYMGEEAVRRSTRTDRSRDPLYNQLKMYAELFRTLGWLHPTPESSLNFTFTLLGKQLDAAGRDYWPLLEECLLGIAYPTRVLSIRGSLDLRPFAFVLRVMNACGGYLSRDEMIIGPLSAPTDRGSSALALVVGVVNASRQSKASCNEALETVASERSTQVNTLMNYTRWPIAVLRDSGWVVASSSRTRAGQRYAVWQLTDKGQRITERVATALDIRLSDAESLPADKRNALTLLSHYEMLARAGFDTSPVESRISSARRVIEPYLAEAGAEAENVLFSPFQSLSVPHIAEVFPTLANGPKVGRDLSLLREHRSGRDDRSHLFVQPRLVRTGAAKVGEAAALEAELVSFLTLYKEIERAGAEFVLAHIGDNKTAFYPLVTHLFQILGYRSAHSRAGVNYQRWDACVWIEGDALPVEIKSPTEELHLSTKAVRQALENKIVLLARGGLQTRRDMSSLVVGYRLPNERGEMSNLIDNVFAAYDLRLGVLDLQTLAHLALRRIAENVTIEAAQLSQLQGFLDV